MGVKIPIESTGDFFAFLIAQNKKLEPDQTPQLKRPPILAVRRITDENPLESIFSRLQQFTSISLAAKLVLRRADYEKVPLSAEVVASKAAGIAFSMRNALDYFSFGPTDLLNKKILGLYYGTMAFAFAEMLASPTGPTDLAAVEAMTKSGHGLFAISGATDSFEDLQVGVLATGFLPQWLGFLGHDLSHYPKKKAKSMAEIGASPTEMICTLRDLFSSMPEIDDLFSEVFTGAPRWIIPVYDSHSNRRSSLYGAAKEVHSTYGRFIDRSGLIDVEQIRCAGWPLAEVQKVESENDSQGNVFRARVDHTGHKVWWSVLPTHSSPFGNRISLLLPTLGGMTEYRTIAAATLYALSIMVRYMPSSWRRIEGGDQDKYLALVNASLRVWERVLPQEFLQSIAGEKVVTTQPDSWLS